jgi:hypothetical protein
MTRELKWRIIALQGMAVIVLGFCAGFLYTESTFVTGMVNDQLAAQNITFPDRDTLVNAKNPDGTPEYTNLVIQYAGQKVDNGDKAYAYGNGFIGVHLHNIANGMTYSEVSAAAAKDPTNTKLAGQKTTLFQGEMLRSTLLNAWGWSQLGLYTLYASIGLALAALVVLAALTFELATARRRLPSTVRKPVTA